MPEITLEQAGTNSIDGLVPMTSMVEQMLPGADSKLKNKLSIKIYNLSRTRNWPWVTVKKRRYYKPETAQIIIGTVTDYADAIARREEQDKKDAAKPKPKIKKARLVRTPKIIQGATKQASLSKDMKQNLKKRIAYIAKINLFKPVQGRTIYSAEDAKEIVSELAAYYQQLQHDTHITTYKAKQKDSQKESKRNRYIDKQTHKKNSNDYRKHPYKRNNRPYTKHQKANSTNFQERYYNLLKDYTQLQEKYAKLLNEKNNLINEKTSELADTSDDLKGLIGEVLKRC